MMTRKSNIDLEEAFLFDRSLIVCHNKGKTGMFGMEDEYIFWIRFPMNKLQVATEFKSNKLQVATEFNYLILWQVEDPDPESHYFVVSVPSETYNEDSASDTCTLETALTLEAKTEDVKKVWIREIRRKTDRRTRCQSRLTTGAWQK